MTLHHLRLLPAALALSLAALTACGDNTQIVQPTPLPNPNTPGQPQPPVVVVPVKVEFRVTGNASQVRVRYSTAADGLVQVVTTLPYITTFTSTESSLFLSLEATPTSYPFTPFPFLSAAIFVNGSLFREASSSDYLLATLTASGTWRR